MTARRLAAGFLAGASSVIALLAVLLLLLFSGGILSLVREVAIARGLQQNVPFWSALGQALIQSFAALPGYLWSARWAILALGLIGLALAAIDELRARVPRPWREHTGGVVTLGAATALVIGYQYANREALIRWVGNQASLFEQQELLLVSDATLLITGLLVGLTLAYIILVAWNAWYPRWSAWLHVRQPEQERPATPVEAAPAASEMMAYQARLARLRRQTPVDEPPPAAASATAPDTEPPPAPATAPASRPWIRIVLAGLAGAVVAAYLVLRLYHAVGPSVMSGGFWVTTDSPRAVVNLPFTREPQQVTLSNTAGAGTAEVSVSPAAGGTSRPQGGRFEFAGSAGQFTSSNVDLHGRAPGNYRLVVTLSEGSGGLVRYIALSGGGLPAQLAAVAVGLAVGLAVALASILLLEVRAEQGAFRGVA